MSLLKSVAKAVLGRGSRRSYSQFGEDLMIRAFLPKGKGTYVDVGCYDPILYSNTYRLYRQGWSGIVIDPNPEMQKLFRFFRPRDRFIEAGVGERGERTYHMFADGAYNTFDPDRAKEYEKRTIPIRTVPMRIEPLSEICKGLTRVDVLNIDVEGLDLEVLKTYDWKFPPLLIIVETGPYSPAADFLKARSYSLVGFTKLNSIFLRA